jgi:threonyl-tRNA synthetase
LSGVLTGLIRVRGPITQNDTHIYVTPEQVEEEFVAVLELFREVYEEIGLADYWFRLSLPDFSRGKYVGDQAKWEEAAAAIRHCLTATKSKFTEELDEAAFYGPKLDVQTKNVNGKEDTIATVQVDVVVPERMGLAYVDAAGNKQCPIIIHKAIMGSFERFMAFLLEKTAGRLPVWLAPEQVRVITVNQEAPGLNFASELAETAKELGVRLTVDNDNESVAKKIRAAELMKVPYVVVVGDKEVASGQVVPRVRQDMEVNKQHAAHAYADFLKTVAHEAKSRVSKTSL